MNLFWTVLVTATSVILGTGFCFWLIQKAHEVESPTWIFEHILCPIIRVLVLLIVVSQVYPVIDTNTSSLDFWRILLQQGQFNNLLNILFFAGLLLAFLPIFSHPVFALPIQSLLTIALVFNWQYADSIASFSLFPSFVTILKITVYMLFAYLVTLESSKYLAHKVDTALVVSGSIRLIADAIHLVLQIPVMLIYCSFLRLQLP